MYQGSKEVSDRVAEQLAVWAETSVSESSETQLVRLLRGGRELAADSLTSSPETERFVDVLLAHKFPSSVVFRTAAVFERLETSCTQIAKITDFLSSDLPEALRLDRGEALQLVIEQPSAAIIEGVSLIAHQLVFRTEINRGFIFGTFGGWRELFESFDSDSLPLAEKAFLSASRNWDITDFPHDTMTGQLADLVLNSRGDSPAIHQLVLNNLPDKSLSAYSPALVEALFSVAETLGSSLYERLIQNTNQIKFNNVPFSTFLEKVGKTAYLLDPPELHFEKFLSTLEQKFCPEQQTISGRRCYQIYEELLAHSQILKVVNLPAVSHQAERNFAHKLADHYADSDSPPFGDYRPDLAKPFFKQVRSVMRSCFDAHYGFSGLTYAFRTPPAPQIASGQPRGKLMEDFCKQTGAKFSSSLTAPGVFPGPGHHISGLRSQSLLDYADPAIRDGAITAMSHLRRESLGAAPESDALRDLAGTEFYFFRGMLAILCEPDNPVFKIKGTEYGLLVNNHHLQYQSLDTALLVPSTTLRKILEPRFDSGTLHEGISEQAVYEPLGEAEPINLGWSSNYRGGLCNGFQVQNPLFHQWEEQGFQRFRDIVGHSHKISIKDQPEIRANLYKAHKQVFDLATAYFDIYTLLKLGACSHAHGALPCQLSATAELPQSMPILRQAAQWIAAAPAIDLKSGLNGPLLVLSSAVMTSDQPETSFILDTASRIMWRRDRPPVFVDLADDGLLSEEATNLVLNEYEAVAVDDSELQFTLKDRHSYAAQMKAMGAKIV